MFITHIGFWCEYLEEDELRVCMYVSLTQPHHGYLSLCHLPKNPLYFFPHCCRHRHHRPAEQTSCPPQAVSENNKIGGGKLKYSF